MMGYVLDYDKAMELTPTIWKRNNYWYPPNVSMPLGGWYEIDKKKKLYGSMNK